MTSFLKFHRHLRTISINFPLFNFQYIFVNFPQSCNQLNTISYSFFYDNDLCLKILQQLEDTTGLIPPYLSLSVQACFSSTKMLSGYWVVGTRRPIALCSLSMARIARFCCNCSCRHSLYALKSLKQELTNGESFKRDQVQRAKV